MSRNRFLLYEIIAFLSVVGSQSTLDLVDNWAVIVDTSRYFFNYRHSSNALAVYDLVRSNGIPDSKIILMLADYPATSPRNPFPARQFFHADRGRSICGPDTEVDYLRDGVNVETFLAVLTGHRSAGAKSLKSTRSSRVLVYLTGHGGDGFMKFGDIEELGSADLADALSVMSRLGRFKELLLVIDTCQADSMTSDIINTPNIISLAAARQGENSFALNVDRALGVSTIDRFTGSVINFLSRQPLDSSLVDLFESLHPRQLFSNAVLKEHNFSRGAQAVSLHDFFAGNPPAVRVAHPPLPSLEDTEHSTSDEHNPQRPPRKVRLSVAKRYRRSKMRLSAFSDKDTAALVESAVVGALVLLVLFGTCAVVVMT